MSFDYRLLTYDAGIWDWLDIYLVTPTGNVTLVNHLGKPGQIYGMYWESNRISLTKNLDQWKNQHVRLVVSVQQDGWGDQTACELTGLAVRTCNVAPLAPLTDPVVISFENGQTIDTDHLVLELRNALFAFRAGVQARNGA